jgi:hypothetical protein
MNDRNGYTVGVETKKNGTIEVHILHNILHIDCMGDDWWAFEYAPHPYALFIDQRGQLRGAFVHLFFTSIVRNIYRID